MIHLDIDLETPIKAKNRYDFTISFNVTALYLSYYPRAAKTLLYVSFQWAISIGIADESYECTEESD